MQSHFLQTLLHSRKFWLAVFGLIQSIVFGLMPGFPRDIWVAIDALVGVLISAIAIEDAGGKFSAGVSLRNVPGQK